jgi:hypothetical protein
MAVPAQVRGKKSFHYLARPHVSIARAWLSPMSKKASNAVPAHLRVNVPCRSHSGLTMALLAGWNHAL